MPPMLSGHDSCACDRKRVGRDVRRARAVSAARSSARRTGREDCETGDGVHGTHAVTRVPAQYKGKFGAGDDPRDRPVFRDLLIQNVSF